MERTEFIGVLAAVVPVAFIFLAMRSGESSEPRSRFLDATRPAPVALHQAEGPSVDQRAQRQEVPVEVDPNVLAQLGAQNQGPRVIIIAEQKSMGLALLLSILFGPLGLLYVSPIGGLCLCLGGLVIGALTFGVGLFFVWLAAIIWAVIGVGQHNEKMAALARGAA